MIQIAPSLLSADFSQLAQEVRAIKKAGADMLHIDVMDGHFVPNITLGPDIVHSMRDKTDLFFDVHLMISDPLKYAPAFCKAGADMITFHYEADAPITECIEIIKQSGSKVGISIKPGTDCKVVFDYLDMLDMVLVMTVEPGFGGQAFMPDMMPKVKSLRQEIKRRRLQTDIQVDGGINCESIGTASKNGANIFVAGSAVFGKSDYAKAISQLREEAVAAQ